MKPLQALPALLLHGLWKLRWYHGLLLLAVIAKHAWYASPHLMLAWHGEPDPARYKVEVGTLRVEGTLKRTGSGPQGWQPPRYFLDTAKGSVEFHCGYLPRPIECYSYFQNADFKGKVLSIASDAYFGVVYIKYPDEMVQGSWLASQEQVAEHVRKGWAWSLRLHRPDLIWLVVSCGAYIVLVLAALRSRLRRPS